MTITECENIIKLFFENNSQNYKHLHNRNLNVNNVNFRLVPDDRFDWNDDIILIEYENTKRPVESISKYWWLFKNTDWLKKDKRIKLLVIGLNEAHKGIRDETLRILGSELELLFKNAFKFFYIPWNTVSEKEILKILNKIVE